MSTTSKIQGNKPNIKSVVNKNAHKSAIFNLFSRTKHSVLQLGVIVYGWYAFSTCGC